MVKFSSLSFLALLALVIYLAAANSFFLNPTICHKVITVLKALSELLGVTNHHYFVARKGCSKTPYKRIAKKERKAVIGSVVIMTLSQGSVGRCLRV